MKGNVEIVKSVSSVKGEKFENFEKTNIIIFNFFSSEMTEWHEVFTKF